MTDDDSELSNVAARGAATTISGQIARFVMQLASIAILARLLEPSDFGLVAMVTAISGLAALLGDFGLSMAAIQAKSLSVAQRSNLFWINTGLGLGNAAIVFALSWPIAWFYGDPQLVEITQALSVVFLLGGMSAQFRSEVSRKFKFRALALSDVLGQAIALTTAVVIAMVTHSYWALIAQQVVAALMSLVLLWISSRWWPSWPSRSPMRALMSYGFNTVAVQLVAYVSSNVDSVLIGRFVGAGALGMYDRAYQLIRLPLQQIASPMTRVAVPILSRVTDPAQYARYAARAQLLLTYLLGGGFFALAVFSNPLLEIVLGPGWDEAKSLLRLLLIGGVFQSMTYVYYWIFLSKALTGLQLRYTLVSRGIMIALMIAGVYWGAAGVAIGSGIGLAINWAILTFLALPHASLKPSSMVRVAARPLLLYAAASAAVAPFAWASGTWTNPWLQTGVIAAVVIAVMTLALVLVRAIRNDVVVLIATAKKVRRRRK